MNGIRFVYNEMPLSFMVDQQNLVIIIAVDAVTTYFRLFFFCEYDLLSQKDGFSRMEKLLLK